VDSVVPSALEHARDGHKVAERNSTSLSPDNESACRHADREWVSFFLFEKLRSSKSCTRLTKFNSETRIAWQHA